jgi:hypothetical protein
MTEWEVLASTSGNPWTVNETVTAAGTRLQYVYHNPTRYLYFKNDLVVAIQR